MGLICSAIVGFLCVQAPIPGTAEVTLEDQGIWLANLVKTKTWTAEWGMSTEHIPPKVDPARLKKACEGEVCVAYWRQCQTGKDGIACRFAFDEGGVARSLSVIAKDPQSLAEAFKSLGIVGKWQKPVVAVPLAAMTEETKGAVPTCATAPCHISD